MSDLVETNTLCEPIRDHAASDQFHQIEPSDELRMVTVDDGKAFAHRSDASRTGRFQAEAPRAFSDGPTYEKSSIAR